MMAVGRLETVVVIAVLVGLAFGAVRWRVAHGGDLERPSLRPVDSALLTVSFGEQARAPYPLARSPFRLDGALVPLHPNATGAEPVPARGQAETYALVLKALVGGPPWSGVLEGLPGAAGARVVRTGDVIGPVFIARVSERGVRVSTRDTAWCVTLPPDAQ
jgi:hypothetical protein